MSSAALLDADFGSESEDDNFNPAPADDSEIEDVGDFNDEVGLKSEEKGVDQKQPVSGNNDSNATKDAPQRNGYLDAGEKVEDGRNDSDQDIGNAAGGDDEDEEDLEDDDDDDEDDEPVHNSHQTYLQKGLIILLGSATKESTSRPQESISRC